MNVIQHPSAERAVTPDPAVLARIEALHSYGNAQGFLSESWGTRNFKRTFQLAYELCQDAVDSFTGLDVSYSPRRGDHLSVSRSSYGSNFHRQLPLVGELAEVFAEELEALAMLRAVTEQKRDEEEQLRFRARQRLNLILEHTLKPTKKEGD